MEEWGLERRGRLIIVVSRLEIIIVVRQTIVVIASASDGGRVENFSSFRELTQVLCTKSQSVSHGTKAFLK